MCPEKNMQPGKAPCAERLLQLEEAKGWGLWLRPRVLSVGFRIQGSGLS